MARPRAFYMFCGCMPTLFRSSRTPAYLRRAYRLPQPNLAPSFLGRAHADKSYKFSTLRQPQTFCAISRTTSKDARSHFASARTQTSRLSTRSYHITRRSSQRLSAIGTEPGLYSDGTTSQRGQSTPGRHGESEIRVIDYSAERIVQHEVSASSLQGFLEQQVKPKWAACRWIYVNGLSRDVVHCLGNTQALHPLAIEDAMDTNSPTKVDWYDDHCFMEMTLQKLVDHQQPDHAGSERAEHPGHHSWRFSSDSKDVRDEDLAQQLAKPSRPPYRKFSVSMEQISVFLTSKDTVITIFERSGQEVYAPIFTRLQSEHTILRSSNDPSMLIQAVIDAVVDLSLPIGKAFGDAFGELELAVLTRPAVVQSRQLYVLRSGLTYFMDTITPIGSLVRTLCDHLAIPAQAIPAVSSTNRSANQPQDFSSTAISPLTQAYLKDVQDHVVMLSSSSRMSIRSAENLTTLIFSTIAAKQNDSIQRLTLVSIFFLPLTFLTGYFGMNFDPMPVVNQNSDVFFWWIATPVMLTTILMLTIRPAGLRLWTWIRRKR